MSEIIKGEHVEIGTKKTSKAKAPEYNAEKIEAFMRAMESLGLA